MSEARERHTMRNRPAALVALLGATALLSGLLPLASAQAAEPWWQVLTGSRPTHLWEPKDDSMVQEVKASKGKVSSFEILVARIEVGGTTVGCLGAGSIGVQSASQICTAQTGFPAAETAAQLQTVLEGPYGAGQVEVSGGPAAVAPLLVTTPGSWPTPISLTPVVAGPNTLGSASAKVTSEGSGRLVITATNLGDAPLDATSTPLEITDELPEGVNAYEVQAEAGRQGIAGPVDCEIPASDLVTCGFEGELGSYEAIEVEVLVHLTSTTQPAPGKVSVSGGNGPEESVPQPLKVSDEPVPFGFERFAMQAEEEGGDQSAHASAHPFQLTNTIQWNSGRQFGPNRGFATVEQPALPRNTGVTFPAGLAGSAIATPRCELTDFLTKTEEFTNLCPDESAVGVATVTIIETLNFGLVRLPVPIFSLPPQHGEPARFGFMVAGVPVLIETSVDPDNEYRVLGEVRNASQLAQVLSATISLWGVPGDPRHDSARGWNCVNLEKTGPCLPPVNRQETPFLRMPVSCDRPLEFLATMEPWNTAPGSVVEQATVTSDPMLACNQVPFDPSIVSALTGKLAESPSGLDFELTMPQSWPASPSNTPEAQPKKVEVTLPEGVTVNPSAAEGLAVCSPAEYARERYDSDPGEGCPEAAKIGNVKISTPLIEEEAEGALYQATPKDNPFDSLIALYLVARIPERGILVKQAGVVEPDPRTGQLISTFDDIPQVPFDSFKLHFREGGRAPLVTPPGCGTFETVARFTPWSAEDPENPKPNEIVERTASFEITRGVDGGACPKGGTPPFEPGFSAGTLSNTAGSHSPFLMRITRRDGDQDLTRFDATLPPGMVAKLAGVSQCPDQAIASMKGKSGKQELANPSCPANSKIGTVSAGAGVGSVLTYVPGSVYLAGPFGEAPLSVVGVVPAVAGPFDVGVVSTRQALTLDPVTGEVKVDGSLSEPIPHILAGIPLKVRDIRVNVDRPEFTLNPTSCEPMAVLSDLWGGGSNPFSLADDSPVARDSRFQAADCASLGFKPRLAFNLKGGSKRADNPAFKAILRPRAGDANLKRTVVRFPKATFLDQAHIRTICTRVQIAADSCPKGSIYGHVRAFTPLLEQPLEGPVYLRSSSNLLPDIVFDLKGVVDIEAAAHADSIGGTLRVSFPQVPDAPVSKVIVSMQGGKKGLLVNSRDLCAGKPPKALVQMGAHNGRAASLKPVLRARCGRKR